MIGGLLRKAARESRWTVAACSAALFIVVIIFTRVLPTLYGAVSSLVSTMPMVKVMIAASLGIDDEFTLTVRMLIGLLWTHPVVMALVWVPAIVLATRFPAGEIDRGTIDVLLGWPVSRLAVLGAETAVWMGGGACVLGAGLLGWMVGRSMSFMGDLPGFGDTLLVCVNLYFVYFAVGGFASLVSALSSRRGTAMGIVFAVVLLSYLINVLAPLWGPAGHVKFASVLEYYQPSYVLMNRRVDPHHLLVLGTCGVLSWLAAAVAVSRRSITTV